MTWYLICYIVKCVCEWCYLLLVLFCHCNTWLSNLFSYIVIITLCPQRLSVSLPGHVRTRGPTSRTVQDYAIADKWLDAWRREAREERRASFFATSNRGLDAGRRSKVTKLRVGSKGEVVVFDTVSITDAIGRVSVSQVGVDTRRCGFLVGWFLADVWTVDYDLDLSPLPPGFVHRHTAVQAGIGTGHGWYDQGAIIENGITGIYWTQEKVLIFTFDIDIQNVCTTTV